MPFRAAHPSALKGLRDRAMEDLAVPEHAGEQGWAKLPKPMAFIRFQVLPTSWGRKGGRAGIIKFEFPSSLIEARSSSSRYADF